MNQKNIKAIIFDCDGTLVSSETPTASLITEILLNNGYRTDIDEILHISRGEKLSVLAEKLESMFPGLDSRSLIQAYNGQILNKLNTDLVPDQATVDVIKNLQLPKCVASNGSRERTEIALKATGLFDFFNGLVVSGYDINAWKPDPKIIDFSARLLNKKPEECLVIDDSIDGLKAGLAAGAQVASFRISNDKLGKLKNYVVQINNLDEIFNLI